MEMVELRFFNVDNEKVKFQMDLDTAYKLALELKYKFKGVIIVIDKSDEGVADIVMCWSEDDINCWEKEDFDRGIEISYQEEYL